MSGPGAFILLLASVTVGQTGERNETANAIDEPIANLIGDLSSTVPSRRKIAVNKLQSRVHSCFSPSHNEVDGDKPKELERLRIEIHSSIPLLSQLMYSSDDDVSRTSLEVLTAAGVSANSVARRVKHLLSDSHASAERRYLAFIALLFVTPEQESVGGVVIRELQRDRAKVAAWDEGGGGDVGFATDFAAGHLAELLYASGHTKSEIVSIMRAASADMPFEWRVVAIKTLGALESEARSAVPRLSQLLDDDDVRIRRSAGTSLLMVTGDTAIIERVAMKLQLSGEALAAFRTTASQMIGERSRRVITISSQNSDLALHLERWLMFGAGPLQRDALKIMRDVGCGNPAIAKATKKLLRSEDSETRMLAHQALVSIGESDWSVKERPGCVLFKNIIGRYRLTIGGGFCGCERQLNGSSRYHRD